MHLTLVMLLMTVLPLVPVGQDTGSRMGMVWADDGDDGGDDGDDGGSSSSGSDPSGGRDTGARRGKSEGLSLGEIRGRLRSLFQRPAARQRTARAPIERLIAAPNEIITRDLSPEDTAALLAQGYGLLEEVNLTSLATTARRFSVPEGTTLEEARAAVQALPTGENADLNHYYRTGADQSDAATPTSEPCAGQHCAGLTVIGWPQQIAPTGCGAPVTLGMVDTGVNPDHEALIGAKLQLNRMTPEDYVASDAIHGTAVAALLVGDPASRSPGLLPGLPLIAVDAFQKEAGDERADAFTLVRALDYLSRSGADVINLSLAGPPNDVLEETLAQLEEQRGIVIVAAAGNGGPNAPPAYPAAYESVIAVTAVDRVGRAYRRAGRGDHVELAAQGVDVWTAASVKGARWKTGTSFAAPYVTAAAALWRQTHPELTPAEIRAAMARDARDLGSEGRDDIFGHGILDLGHACPGTAIPRILAID